MASLKWRNKVCAGALALIIYLTITAFFSISQIQSRLPKFNVNNNNNKPKNLHQPRSLASFVNNKHNNNNKNNKNNNNMLFMTRMTPKRIRSKMGPAIDWCVPLKYRKKSGPTVALASFPGSGNTWLRYLLQQSSGILTGSVYKDYALLKNGFPAESVVNGSVSAVKTHEFGAQTVKSFDKVILLVRNPFEALQAEFNRRSGGHVGHAPAEKYSRNNGKYWRTFVASKAEEWVKMNLAWYDAFEEQNKLVVLYSDLLENTEAVLRKVLDFLELNSRDETIRCAMSRKEGIYKRSKKSNQVEVFDSKMKKLLDEKIGTLYGQLGLEIPPPRKSHHHNNENIPKNLSSDFEKETSNSFYYMHSEKTPQISMMSSII